LQQAQEAPTNGRKRKNTRLPATSSVKPTMSVPPHARAPVFDPMMGTPGAYQPPPYMPGCAPSYKMGAAPSPGHPGALSYPHGNGVPPGYHSGMPHGMPRMPSGAPPHPASTTTAATVNNTYVNANVHVQQLNIQVRVSCVLYEPSAQNVQGPMGAAEMSAHSMHHMHGNGAPPGGGIPMPGPGAPPYGHPAAYHPGTTFGGFPTNE